jgi:hypothetical protein
VGELETLPVKGSSAVSNFYTKHAKHLNHLNPESHAGAPRWSLCIALSFKYYTKALFLAKVVAAPGARWEVDLEPCTLNSKT